MNRKMSKLFLSIFLVLNAHAFVPDLGHVVRHQPMLLKGSPQSFTVNGTIDIDGEKATFVLSWAGVQSGYALEVKKIPSSWMSNPESITLIRDGSECVLLIARASFPCLPLRFWGDMELSGSGERVVQTLSQLGVASSSDMVFRAINSKELEKKKASTIVPVVKAVQGVTLSVLEHQNKNGLFIGFDSTTFAPLSARIPVEGMNWDFNASPDFNLEKDENRNNVIVSKKIEISEANKTLAIVRREALKRTTKITLPTYNSKASIAQIPNDRFTDKGRLFLKVLLLTH